MGLRAIVNIVYCSAIYTAMQRIVTMNTDYVTSHKSRCKYSRGDGEDEWIPAVKRRNKKRVLKKVECGSSSEDLVSETSTKINKSKRSLL